MENSFITGGIFYRKSKNVIEPLTFIEDTISLIKRFHNAGDLSQVGLQTSGSFKINETITLNPDFRIWHVQSKGNTKAKSYSIDNNKEINYSAAMSAMYLLNHSFSLSFSVQYNNQQTRIQNNYLGDALYFLSIDKLFFDRLKLGIRSAIPFKGSFRYQGAEINGLDFNQKSQDYIRTSTFPVWFTINYSFASGKKAGRTSHKPSFKEGIRKKGF